MAGEPLLKEMLLSLSLHRAHPGRNTRVALRQAAIRGEDHVRQAGFRLDLLDPCPDPLRKYLQKPVPLAARDLIGDGSLIPPHPGVNDVFDAKIARWAEQECPGRHDR